MYRRIHPQKRMIIATVVVIVAIISCCVIYVYNPADVRWMPRCIWHELTGTQCPSCGSTRAMHQFLHGNISAGLRFNPFILFSWPYFAFVAIYEIFNFGKTHPRWFWRLVYVYVVLYCVWWVVRNIYGI